MLLAINDLMFIVQKCIEKWQKYIKYEPKFTNYTILVSTRAEVLEERDLKGTGSTIGGVVMLAHVLSLYYILLLMLNTPLKFLLSWNSVMFA